MVYKKLSPKKREQKKHNRLYPFNEKTPFWNLLTRRNQYYEDDVVFGIIITKHEGPFES